MPALMVPARAAGATRVIVRTARRRRIACMASARQIMVGNVPVGGGAPVAVQTMTKTETANLQATMDQIHQVAEAGADIVRVAVPPMRIGVNSGSLPAHLHDLERDSPGEALPPAATEFVALMHRLDFY